jgi:ubiquinone/menaquinone biosynthesis C-methylase UbiE
MARDREMILLRRPAMVTIVAFVVAALFLHARGQTPAYEGYATGAKSRDGLGRYYFGREIAHFMSHVGAPWLDRPEREQEERPDLVVQSLRLKPGDRIADLGCGTGYFSSRLAKAVGPEGIVYGVEIQAEMLKILGEKMSEQGISNVVGVLGTVDDPRLPEQVDLVLIVDVYHEMSHPAEMIAAVCRRLKAGGRVAFVEYRAEDPKVPIKPLHKMSEAQIRREMAVQPLEYVETVDKLPRQHLVIFRKRPDPSR